MGGVNEGWQQSEITLRRRYVAHIYILLVCLNFLIVSVSFELLPPYGL